MSPIFDPNLISSDTLRTVRQEKNRVVGIGLGILVILFYVLSLHRLMS